ncbi:MAG: FAD binding domain-containing protein, partial [Chitinophagaceae bacterium]
ELDYRSATCCLMSLGNAQGKHIVTIEGTNVEGLNFIQQAMAEEGATQCGFCTPGFVVSLAGFCLSTNDPEYNNAIESIDGNICRCTGYKSIERAAGKIAMQMKMKKEESPINFAVDKNILPAYFKTIKSTLSKLTQQGNGNLVTTSSGSRFLAGGTDIYVQEHDTFIHEEVNFLFDNKELNGIEISGEKCFIGASATVTDIVESEIFRKYFPITPKIKKLISSTPIRNMATIGGNFINASPIGDLTIIFLALNAGLILRDGENKREILLKDFYLGYKKLNKEPREIIQQVWFDLPGKNDLFNFEKVCKRTYLDIASVNSACKFSVESGIINEANFSAGGVGPVPMYLSRASSFIQGKKNSPELIEELIEISNEEISPISDVRGSEKYKRLLLGQLLKAHFEVLL